MIAVPEARPEKVSQDDHVQAPTVAQAHLARASGSHSITVAEAATELHPAASAEVEEAEQLVSTPAATPKVIINSKSLAADNRAGYVSVPGHGPIGYGN